MRKLFFDIFGAGWGTTRPYLRVPSESGGDRPPVARGGVRVANLRRSRELCSKTVRTPTAELFGEKRKASSNQARPMRLVKHRTQAFQIITMRFRPIKFLFQGVCVTSVILAPGVCGIEGPSSGSCHHLSRSRRFRHEFQKRRS